jgi:hypothetical protein
MPEALQYLVRFRTDKLFNGAVNIDWFGTNEERANAASEAYVFHGPQYHGVSQHVPSMNCVRAFLKLRL